MPQFEFVWFLGMWVESATGLGAIFAVLSLSVRRYGSYAWVSV